ncbi:Ribosomal RNA small subunit methyltransferase D [Rubripirellula amarantea]|uniref:Ribosomal RNA small subunit methyltransferase D n=2 Tax=Rubripirellula amarantea TaxID=2527999 RepID=A0A5C5WEE1_9BACT|nr:Ribosomal RNA small subunit methyltransferase D [Rubripirellula amarantea]
MKGPNSKRNNSGKKSGISKKSDSGKNSAPKNSSGKPSKVIKPLKLRIIGGDMRGRTVTYHGADFTRPMKDNIRENLFNILGRAIKSSVAFDLFAGTGALGFESLSRGASSCVMVEQNRQAVREIQKTAETLDVAGRTKIIASDTFRVAGSLLAVPAQDTPWIVYLCPPYALWTEAFDPLMLILKTAIANAPPGSVIVTETDKTTDLDTFPPGDWDYRTYGKTTLGFIEPANRCGALS